MDVRESVDVAVPLERAWPLLHDVHLVASCLPGARLDGGPDENGEYPGRLDVRFGPTKASFAGRARLDYDDAERCVQIRGRGQDARGRTRAAVDVVVLAEPVGTDGTRLRVEGAIEVVGALERFASTGGVYVARELMAAFSQNLAAHLASASTASDPPSAARPTPHPVAATTATRTTDAEGASSLTARRSGGAQHQELRLGRLLLAVLRRWFGRRTS